MEAGGATVIYLHLLCCCMPRWAPWRLSGPFRAGSHQPRWLSYGDNGRMRQCCSNKPRWGFIKASEPTGLFFAAHLPAPSVEQQREPLSIYQPTKRHALSFFFWGNSKVEFVLGVFQTSLGPMCSENESPFQREVNEMNTLVMSWESAEIEFSDLWV